MYIDIQEFIIAIGLIFGIAFFAGYRKRTTSWMKLFSLIASLGLLAMSFYESYMYFVWEKRVHAPIRLDIVFIDLPIMAVSCVIGVLPWAWALFGLFRRTRSTEIDRVSRSEVNRAAKGNVGHGEVP